MTFHKGSAVAIDKPAVSAAQAKLSTVYSHQPVYLVVQPHQNLGSGFLERRTINQVRNCFLLTVVSTNRERLKFTKLGQIREIFPVLVNNSQVVFRKVPESLI